MYSRFAAVYERIFPFREGVYSFLREASGSATGRVLDVGCGPGHYAGRFATDGGEAVGIDLDEAMIAAARERYPRASFQRLDMTALDALEPPFDLIFCIGNVAAHVDREAYDGVARGVAELLAPGGRWVVQTVNWDAILARGGHDFPPRELDGEGLAFLREYQDFTSEEVCFVTRLQRGEEVLYEGRTALFPQRAADFGACHRRQGLATLSHFSDFGRAPFDPLGGAASILVCERDSH